MNRHQVVPRERISHKISKTLWKESKGVTKSAIGVTSVMLTIPRLIRSQILMCENRKLTVVFADGTTIIVVNSRLKLNQEGMSCSSELVLAYRPAMSCRGILSSFWLVALRCHAGGFRGLLLPNISGSSTLVFTKTCIYLRSNERRERCTTLFTRATFAMIHFQNWSTIIHQGTCHLSRCQK
jgi:hypothetical protein